MKTGRYSLKELLTHNEIEQIIIPEIQRDYVWQQSNVKSLIESIIDRYKNKSSRKIEISVKENILIENSISEYLQKEYDKLKNNIKVGFIYAYHDNEYVGKFFLIDGQQRFTTLYLLLLAIYVRNFESAKFKEYYFKNEILKIDYKVRESSHEFMKELVRNELDNELPEKIQNSKRYYDHIYNEDVTVVNLIKNYSEICCLIDEDDSLKTDGNLDKFIEFVEDYVEVNYFDTNLSEQGEQLYLYMNSRGEFLSHHEIVKSEIVKKIGDGTEFIEKKKEIGDNWETWQNFFWNNRNENESADIGFDEFLKWVTIINICTIDAPQLQYEKGKNQTFREAKENYIQIHKSNEKRNIQREYLTKYQIQFLDGEFLRSSFEAVKMLSELKSDYIPLGSFWLYNINGAINYIILLPLIYFVKNSNWSDNNEKKRDIERMAMFLKNITYFESVSKNPDNAVIDAIELVKNLCDRGETDIIGWTSDNFLEGKYKSILTTPEREKLDLYKLSGNNRAQLEEVIWNITNNERISTFIKGNISIFIHTVNSKDANNLIFKSIDSTNIQLIKEYGEIFNDIIANYDLDKTNDKADIFRRALLTFGDYTVSTSGSYRFGNRIDGYTFGYYNNRDNKEWEEIMDKKKDVWANFFFSVRTKLSRDFTEIIDSYNENDWKEPFIKNGKILKYCNKKRILSRNVHSIFLIEEKDKGYKEIQCFLLNQYFKDYAMEIFMHNICVLNFKYSVEEQKLVFERNNYAINIIKDGDNWHYKLIYRDKLNLDGKFDLFLNKDWILTEEENDRIEKKDNVLYIYDYELSIIQNVENISKKVKLLYCEVEEIFKQQQLLDSDLQSDEQAFESSL